MAIADPKFPRRTSKHPLPDHHRSRKFRDHTDHLDGETLLPLLCANPGLAFLAPEANRQFVAERLSLDGDAPHGIASGQEVELAGVFHNPWAAPARFLLLVVRHVAERHPRPYRVAVADDVGSA